MSKPVKKVSAIRQSVSLVVLPLILACSSPLLANEVEQEGAEQKTENSLLDAIFQGKYSRKCKPTGYQMPRGKPPLNRHKYNQCLKKVRALQDIDF